MFFLSTEHLDLFELGDHVGVEFSELKNNLSGKAALKFIDPQVDSRSGLFRLRFEFDNKDAKIKPGVRVRMKLPKINKL